MLLYEGMKNLKAFTVSAAFLLIAAMSATAQVPAQYNSMNSVTGVGGNATATVTLTGVANTRVRIYSITAVCNTAGSTFIPTVVVTDAGNTIISYTAQTISNEAPPIRPFKWNPGLTASIAGTVVISANVGGACTGGTTLTVQADQF